jgi:hypothetical protein
VDSNAIRNFADLYLTPAGKRIIEKPASAYILLL